jgi:hypothetical protein
MSTIDTRNALALLNRSISGLLVAAMLDRPLTAQFWRGQINALRTLLGQGDAPSLWALKDAASGYQPNACFERAWPALPVDIDQRSLAEVQELLRGHGTEITPEPIPDRNVDAVVQLQHGVPTLIVLANDEHAAARVDVRDGASGHVRSPSKVDVIVPPAIGQYWPEQSAWYAGPVAYPDGRVIALLFPDGQESLGKLPWGEYGKQVPGAASHHDGRANTAAMAEAASPAAQAVHAINRDWYIPSQIEALQLYATLKAHVGPGLMWTSTQLSADGAVVQVFENGRSSWNGKDYDHRVRAVRGLTLYHFSTSAEGGAA